MIKIGCLQLCRQSIFYVIILPIYLQTQNETYLKRLTIIREINGGN